MIVSGGYERSSTNGYVQGYNFCFEMKLELTPCPMPHMTVNPIILIRHACSKGVLRTQTFNNLSSALSRPDSYREQCYKWQATKSRHRKTYFNLKQIVHSLNLRSPLFRIDWCGTQQLANPLTFIAAGAAVAFIRCCLLFFKGAHGLVVPPRHGYFLLQKKNQAPAAMSGMKL